MNVSVMNSKAILKHRCVGASYKRFESTSNNSVTQKLSWNRWFLLQSIYVHARNVSLSSVVGNTATWRDNEPEGHGKCGEISPEYIWYSRYAGE